MKNKILLIVAIFLIFGLFAASPVLAKQLVLKISTLSPENTFLVEMFKNASNEIEEKTEGRVKLKLYTGGVMGNDTVVMRKMRVNKIHGATFTAGGISAAYSNYQIMSLPLLFNNYDEVDAVRKVIDPKLTKALKKKGYVSFGIVDAGFAYVMSNFSVTTPEDLKNRKVWIPEGDPIGSAVFKEAGVSPIPLPLPDVLTGLQTGLIDTVMTSPIGAVVLQWYTKVKYLTEHPLVYIYGTFALSDKAWNKIAENDRPIIREILEKYIKKANAQTRIDNEKALKTLKNQGIQFVSLNPDSYKKMLGMSNAAIDTLVKSGEFEQLMLNEIRAILKSHREGN